MDPNATTQRDAKPSPAQHVLQFFVSQHLPARLRRVAEPFEELAAFVAQLPGGPEQTVALRKLLESKDCAVRCLVSDRDAAPPEQASAVLRGRLLQLIGTVELMTGTLEPQTVVRMLRDVMEAKPA